MKIIIGLAALLLASTLLLDLTGYNFLWTATQRTWLSGNDTANINDHEVFETRVIRAGTAQPWPEHAELDGGDFPAQLLQQLRDNDAVAFLVVYDGEVLAEQYLQDYGPRSKTNSFSMAKTVVTLLLGKAIEEGYIEGLDQPVTDFLPEFGDDPMAALATLGSLSSMTSGYEWDEHYYSAFSPTVKLVYGDDVADFVLDGEFTREPESYFYYSSASTQLLAIAVARALQAVNPDLTLTDYLSEKLWQPLGMNDDGLWHLDNSGMELGFCCLNTNARNFAKFGQLMLEDGSWQGQQLVPAQFVAAMRTPLGSHDYGYSTWINADHEVPFYTLRGHLGQYVVIVPDHKLVLVRLGESRDASRDTMDDVLPFYIEQALLLL